MTECYVAVLFLLVALALCDRNEELKLGNSVAMRFMRNFFNHFDRKQPREGAEPMTTTTTAPQQVTTTPPTWKPNPLDYTYRPPFIPQPTDYQDCINRPVHWTFGGHAYFYSAHETTLNRTDDRGGSGPTLTWDDAFALCRKYCMDPINIETELEWQMVRDFINKHRVQFTWTSGHKCDFQGCERLEDNEPNIVNGWYWMGSQVRLSPTNRPPLHPNGTYWSEQPWLPSGEGKIYPQPDNAELNLQRSKNPESCIGIIWRIYDLDRVGLHDIACYHPKYVMCEDNKDLIKLAYQLKRDNESRLKNGANKHGKNSAS